MTAKHLGRMLWRETMTKDLEKAKRFYGVGPSGILTFGVGEGMENQIADVQTAEGPVPPNWLTYVVVEKIEPATAKAESLGGKTMMPAMAVPNVGRIAVVVDDQGAALGLFEPGGI
jgi:hypothetical protein